MGLFGKKNPKEPAVSADDFAWVNSHWPPLDGVVADTLRQVGFSEVDIDGYHMYATLAPVGDPENIWMQIERMCLTVALERTAQVIRAEKGDLMADTFLSVGASGRSATGLRRAINFLLRAGVDKAAVAGYGSVAAQALSDFGPKLVQGVRIGLNP